MKIIGIDLDNTLFSCNSKAYEFVSKLKSESKEPLKFYEVDNNNIPKNNFFFKKIFKFCNSSYYHELPKAVDTINELFDKGYKIYFISSRPKTKISINLALEWLKNKNVKYDKLVLACNNKPEYSCLNNIDFFIDDKKEICREIGKSGVTSLFICSDKKEENNDYFIKVSSWEMISNFFACLDFEIDNKFDCENENI